jgi:hypothetical protein
MTDPQYQTRLWLQAELAKRPHGTKGKLAAAIRVRADAITRMANTDPNKETREIKAHELDGMKKFFAAESPDPAADDDDEVEELRQLIKDADPDVKAAVKTLLRKKPAKPSEG